MSEYTVITHEHGVILKCPYNQITIDDWLKFSKAHAKKKSVLAVCLQRFYDAHTVIAHSPEHFKKWREEVDAECAKMDTHTGWIHGTDTGISSEALYRACRDGARFSGKTPRDADDFGRCIRMVRRFGYESKLPEIAKELPDWSPILNNWRVFELLYDEGKHDEITTLLGKPSA